MPQTLGGSMPLLGTCNCFPLCGEDYTVSFLVGLREKWLWLHIVSCGGAVPSTDITNSIL